MIIQFILRCCLCLNKINIHYDYKRKNNEKLVFICFMLRKSMSYLVHINNHLNVCFVATVDIY